MADTFTALAPTTWSDGADHRRLIADAANAAVNGRINSRGAVTLTASAATTVVSDLRAGATSVILFMPTTANAATEQAAGGFYVSSQGKQTFTITHANNAQTDRAFRYVVLGG